MRRAAVSAPSNIVEGCARESQAEYVRFFEITFGSLREVHYQFSLAKRLGYIKDDDKSNYDSKIVETEKDFRRFNYTFTLNLTAGSLKTYSLQSKHLNSY